VPQLPSRSRMNITDIPAELQEKILRNIEDYSIVLLVDGQLCGTGTLITIDGVYGILTAAHVAQTLDESERAGTLATILDRRGSQLVGEPAKHFEIFATKPAGEWGIFGPDLAFVRLPSPSGLLSGLLTKKSFWDLTRKGVAQRPVVILDKTPMASYGAVDERTERTENMVRLNTFLVYGASPKVFEWEGYDYIDMRSRRSLQPEMPTRFGGLSGSGVWRFDIARYHKDRFELFGFHLAGVAFYQLPESEPDIVAIRYHGPLSIYQRLLPAVRNWLSR